MNEPHFTTAAVELMREERDIASLKGNKLDQQKTNFFFGLIKVFVRDWAKFGV